MYNVRNYDIDLSVTEWFQLLCRKIKRVNSSGHHYGWDHTRQYCIQLGKYCP